MCDEGNTVAAVNLLNQNLISDYFVPSMTLFPVIKPAKLHLLDILGVRRCCLISVHDLFIPAGFKRSNWQMLQAKCSFLKLHVEMCK